jgi:antitoxin component YwqK of YwqJK toxin-antitoxin module
VRKTLKYIYIILVCFLLIGVALNLLFGGWLFPVKVTNVTKESSWLKDIYIMGLIEDGYRVNCHKKRNGFKNWELDGNFQVFNREGIKIIKGTYKNGLLHGPIIEWHDNGQIAQKEEWHHGIRINQTVNWDEKGNKIREVNFSDGRKSGQEIYWNSDGTIYRIFHWRKQGVEKIELYEKGIFKEALVGEVAKKLIRKKAKEWRENSK